MSTVGVLGHFGVGHNLANGQTVKTKNVYRALCNVYGAENISMYDTHGGIAFFARMPFVLLRAFITCKAIVVMPAHKGICIMTPLFLLLNLVFHRSIHYVVIGGWLPEMLSAKRWLLQLLKHYTYIYVETETMNVSIQSLGLRNTVVMPNFKYIEINKEIKDYNEIPLRICTFSRITKNKGIAEAVKAVSRVNERLGKKAFTLDIYGQIEDRVWFDEILPVESDCVKYMGCVSQEKIIPVLKGYFALLFPTYYEGECFAGTIIDAYSAGLPVFASDWHENPNLVEDMKTGLIFKAKSIDAIEATLIFAFNNYEQVNKMRANCIEKAMKFQPDKVIKVLTSRIG